MDVALGLPLGASPLVGTPAPGDLTVAFRFSISAGPFDGLAALARTAAGDPIAPTGAGVLAGGGLLPQATGISSVGSVSFAYPADAVTATAVLPTFFISFADLVPGDAFFAGVTSLLPPSFGRTDLGSTTAVPEPARAPLAEAAAAGIAGLVARGRRSRRRVVKEIAGGAPAR